MARKLHKKGPQSVKTSRKPETSDELERQEFEAELDTFAEKVHGVIEEARAKMTDREREKADKAADAILRSAISGSKPSRHTA